jgi:DNA-directed RNA polymerase subunit RPC12/RpoP
VRLLSRKIYRAFPELDQFSDAVCKQYLKIARKGKGAWVGKLCVVLSVPVTISAWIILVNILTLIPYDSKAGPAFYLLGARITVIEFVEYIVSTGFLWVPIVVAYLVRDFFLYRCLRKRVLGSKCPSCTYSLLGLQATDLPLGRGVQCPECGWKIVFRYSHLSEESLTPNLLSDS